MVLAKLGPLFRAPTERQKRLTYAFVAALVATIAIVHEAVQGKPVFPVDDAYITLHNAEVLDSGTDPNYHVPGLVGATSCAHVLLVALVAKVLPALWALEAVTWVAILAYAISLAYMGFLVGGSVAVAVGTTVLGLTVGQMPHQLLNGLETGFTLAIMTWAVALALRDDTAQRSVHVLPVLCGLLPFARPELVAFSGLLLASRWYRARGGGGRDLRALVVRDVALAALAALPFVIAYWKSTGSFSPNTIAAKKFFFADGCAPSADKLKSVASLVLELAQTLGIFSLSIVALGRSRVERVALAFVLVFLFAYYLEFPGALSHYEQRYMYVFVPLLLLATARAAASDHTTWARFGSFVLVAGVLETVEHFHERWLFHQATRGFTSTELAGVAEYVQNNTSPDAVILIHDAGYMSTATSRRLVDLVGLKTPLNAKYHRDITWTTCGRARGDAVAAIARAAHPGFLVVLDGWDDFFGISEALRAHGWTTQSLRPSAARYRVYRLSEPPEAR